MLEDLFGVCAESSEIVGAELLGGDGVARWEGMLIWKSPAEI